MLMMRALWGPPWRRKKPRKKKPFTGGTRGSAALASGLILLRRRPEASKAIPGTTRAKRSAFARSFGDLALPDLMATASAADPLQGGPRHCGLRPRIMYIYTYIDICAGLGQVVEFRGAKHGALMRRELGLNPKSKTANRKPETRNPETPNPQTLNPRNQET